MLVLIICVLVFIVFCIVCTVFFVLFCLCICFVTCFVYCHRVTTQLQLVVVVIIIIIIIIIVVDFPCICIHSFMTLFGIFWSLSTFSSVPTVPVHALFVHLYYKHS
jgi:hypothetical protein